MAKPSGFTYRAGGRRRRAPRAASSCCCQRRCCCCRTWRLLRSLSLGPSLSHTCTFAFEKSNRFGSKSPGARPACSARSRCQPVLSLNTNLLQKQNANVAQHNSGREKTQNKKHNRNVPIGVLVKAGDPLLLLLLQLL